MDSTLHRQNQLSIPTPRINTIGSICEKRRFLQPDTELSDFRRSQRTLLGGEKRKRANSVRIQLSVTLCKFYLIDFEQSVLNIFGQSNPSSSYCRERLCTLRAF